MKQLAALAWKEWHEVRIYLWIAMGVFIGLPVIGMLEAKYQHVGGRYEISASPWVLIFGGVLAVFVAVGATCRDFNGRLEDFWHSRPLNVARWLLVKYFVGLTVVLLSCVLPLIVELNFNRHKDALLLAVWFPFMWAATYSIGFLAGCVLRRTAHAAMLALAGMLLVWFLPLVLPPLRWMSLTAISDTYLPEHQWPEIFGVQYVEFAAAMATLAIVVTALSMTAARRGWHIQAGRKMMYGSISAALLILFASAAFQLGTNLPILAQVDLSQTGYQPRNYGLTIHCVGQRGLMLTGYLTQSKEGQWTRDFITRTFDLTPSGIELSTATVTHNVPYVNSPQIAWSPDHLDIQYLGSYLGKSEKEYSVMLSATSLVTGAGYQPQHLWDDDVSLQRNGPVMLTLYIRQNRLYVVGSHAAVLDISDPLKPKLISNTPLDWSGGTFGYDYQEYNYSETDQLTIALPPVSDLSPAERLELVMKSRDWMGQQKFDGEFFCSAESGGLFAYRLTNLNAVSAKFKKIGQYQPTTLEGIFGLSGYEQLIMQNGLIYTQSYARNSFINSSISVFDLHSNPPLRMIGHFAAPGAEVVHPLPDGRAIIGGSKLWLVGPPKGRSADHSGGN